MTLMFWYNIEVFSYISTPYFFIGIIFYLFLFPSPLSLSLQIRKMDLEARSLQPSVKAMLLAKLREYKSDLNNLKKEFKRLTSPTADQAAREDLLETGMADTHLVCLELWIVLHDSIFFLKMKEWSLWFSWLESYRAPNWENKVLFLVMIISLFICLR